MSSTCFEQPSVYPQEDLYMQFYGIFCIVDVDQTTCTDAWNTIKLHVQVFLRINTWLFETCRRQYNWIKSLMGKMCILLVPTTHVCHNARFKKRKFILVFSTCPPPFPPSPAVEQDQDIPSWSCSQVVSKPVWHIPLLCVQWKTPDDGQRNCSKHAEFHSKINLRN